jgi:tRNA(fMet)-specific endonuclease VapC
MGGVIDTSVFAACERKRWSAKATITHILQTVHGPVVLSAVVAAELTEGIYRAKSAHESGVRTAFVHDIFQAFLPVSFTKATALIAGQIRGEQGSAGNTLPTADSFIAATALELHCAVITLNVKDFIRIPGLQAIPFLRP